MGVGEQPTVYGGCHLLLGMTMWLCVLHKAPQAEPPHSRALPSQMNRHNFTHRFLRQSQGSSNCLPLCHITFMWGRPHLGLETRTLTALPESWVRTFTLGFLKHALASLTFQNVSLPGAPHGKNASVSHWNICYCPIQLNTASSHVPRSQRWVLEIKQSDVLEL